MTIESKLTRRTLIKAAAWLTPVALTGCTTPQRDDDLMLRADDPVARSLLYYPKSSDVPSDHPLAAKHQPSQTCATCIHVRGEPGESARKCPAYPGRLVNADGWCSVWAKG